MFDSCGGGVMFNSGLGGVMFHLGGGGVVNPQALQSGLTG